MIITIQTRQDSTLHIKLDSIECLDERQHTTILTSKTGHRYELSIMEGNHVREIMAKVEGYVNLSGYYNGPRELADGQRLVHPQPQPIPQNLELGSHRRSDV